MKILEKNAGALTNFEVLELLRSRGASTDTTKRIAASITPSEFQVFDYLVQTAACNQTRENIKELLERCEELDLAKAEKINIVNLRPSSAVEMFLIVEEREESMGTEKIEELVEELVNLTVEVLPPPPEKPEETAKDIEEAASDHEKKEAI